MMNLFDHLTRTARPTLRSGGVGGIGGIGALLSLLLLALAPAACADSATSPAPFAVVDVRLFDGTTLWPTATVVVRDGTIEAVGAEIPLPADIEIINGTGATLLPGLIDAHTHSWLQALDRAVIFGVTTQLDQFTPTFSAQQEKKMRQDGQFRPRADLFSAGTLATAPGGHGTQYGFAIPTLTKPEEADAWVAARLEEGSDWIKIVSEDGTAVGREIPTLDRATIQALIEASHRRGALAVVHVTTLSRAREAIEAGTDGLVHIFGDQPADEALVALAVEKGVFVVPTLAVLGSFDGQPTGASLVEDDPLTPYLNASEKANLAAGFPGRKTDRGTLKNSKTSIRALHRAGVTILAGTDAPNPGTTWGASMVRELELLVDTGLTPTEALHAATAANAKAFRLDDRGQIAPGKIADMVLVEGDPTTDLSAMHRIRQVWKRGLAIERIPQAAAVRDSGTSSAGDAIPAEAKGRMLANFEDGANGALEASFGAWQESTDAMMGGKSTVTLTIADGGAAGTKHHLRIAGTLAAGSPFPWAGVMWMPSGQGMSPVDLSSRPVLRFAMRAQLKSNSEAESDSAGDSKAETQVVVLIFTSTLSLMPATQTISVGSDWTSHELPLAQFDGVDPAEVTAVFFGPAGGLGPFELQLDEVDLVRPRP